MQGTIRGTGLTDYIPILQIPKNIDINDFVSLSSGQLIYKNPIEVRGQSIYQFTGPGFYSGKDWSVPGIPTGYRYKHYMFLVFSTNMLASNNTKSDGVSTYYYNDYGLDVLPWRNTSTQEGLYYIMQALGLATGTSVATPLNGIQIIQNIASVTSGTNIIQYNKGDGYQSGHHYGVTPLSNVKANIRSLLKITDELLGLDEVTQRIFSELPVFGADNQLQGTPGIWEWVFADPVESLSYISKDLFSPTVIKVRLNNISNPDIPNRCCNPFIVMGYGGQCPSCNFTYTNNGWEQTTSETIIRHGVGILDFLGVEKI